jgi:hypothetical protein
VKYILFKEKLIVKYLYSINKQGLRLLSNLGHRGIKFWVAVEIIIRDMYT